MAKTSHDMEPRWPFLFSMKKGSYRRGILERAIFERLYNLREGLEEDIFPVRFFEEDMTDEFEEGKRIPKQRFTNARALYYEMRGWNEKGEPNIKKLKELDLEPLK
jgi:aldehyde:ferredoxin oxidoreductase